jgi:branched-chain amino acid aminotransferase
VYTLSVDPDDPGSAVISECGAMNLFFVLQQSSDSSNSSSEKPALEVVTPPLDGTILPGITRDSIIQLLQQ